VPAAPVEGPAQVTTELMFEALYIFWEN